MPTDNNRRITKNALMLYFRMFLSMGVSLYTSRVVLHILGVEDFGIYNVVGGVVLMFSFLSSSMANATQRFLSFEIGKNDYIQLKKVFSMSVNIHALITLIILILAETIGVWFLNSKLNIPIQRLDAANWVYQFSILTFMLTVMGVPYNAIIIAHERMDVYAYVSIIEVTLKLIIVYLLFLSGYDKLKIYCVLIFLVSLIIWSIYKIYSKKKFSETNYSFFWDRSLFKTMINYASWTLFGNLASVAMGQGINIMLNVFFGPAINAARGIAYQVNGAVNGFVSNFQVALNPQIVKSFATDKKEYMHQLIYRGAKYSFFLLFIITLPILLESEFIINKWLTNVPEYTILFCRLILIAALIDCISGPLGTAALASGKIKRYQIVVGSLQLMILPISYLLLKIGYAAQITLYVTIIISIISLFVRLIIISPLVELSIVSFVRYVLVPILAVITLSLIISLSCLFAMNPGILRFIFVSFISLASSLFSIILLGLKKDEKIFIKNGINYYVNKKNIK